jgi:hypothetical protein
MDIRVNNYCEQGALAFEFWGLIRRIAFISRTFETLAGRFRTSSGKLIFRVSFSLVLMYKYHSNRN